MFHCISKVSTFRKRKQETPNHNIAKIRFRKQNITPVDKMRYLLVVAMSLVALLGNGYALPFEDVENFENDQNGGDAVFSFKSRTADSISN
jgi:hypothetical protein